MFKLRGEWGPDEDISVIGASLGIWLLMAIAEGPGNEAPRGQTQEHRPGPYIVREQMIVRSVRVRPLARNAQSPIVWREARKAKCVAVRSIVGTTMIHRNSVDFILRNRTRVRARLDESCPALDYYRGFYVSPGPDGMICAERDFLRSRMGRQCGIDRFRILRPVRVRGASLDKPS